MVASEYFRFYTNRFREAFFSLTVRGGMEVNLRLVVRGMVFTTGTAFFSGMADADAFTIPEEVPEEDGAVDEVEAVSESRGGTFSADSAVSSDEEVPPPKNPLSLPTKKDDKLTNMVEGSQDNLPVIVSSLISPNTIASDTEIKPDSESVIVALTTGSEAPFSVRLAMASATFPISTSIMRVGKPLYHNTRSKMKESAKKGGRENSRRYWSLVIKMNREVFLPLERHHFLRTDS